MRIFYGVMKSMVKDNTKLCDFSNVKQIVKQKQLFKLNAAFLNMYAHGR